MSSGWGTLQQQHLSGPVIPNLEIMLSVDTFLWSTLHVMEDILKGSSLCHNLIMSGLSGMVFLIKFQALPTKNIPELVSFHIGESLSFPSCNCNPLMWSLIGTGTVPHTSQFQLPPYKTSCIRTLLGLEPSGRSLKRGPSSVQLSYQKDTWPLPMIQNKLASIDSLIEHRAF